MIGGETAEMPGVYQGQDFDLAGFCVGIVEKDSVIDGSRVALGNKLVALASSGVHSNGFSLVRKVIEVSNADLSQPCGTHTLAEALIEPTRIYVKSLLELSRHCQLNAIAHITGGGLIDNIPRVLPAQLAASIDLSSWELPAVFKWLQQSGNIDDEEMMRTFNCGAGMVLAIDAQQEQQCLQQLRQPVGPTTKSTVSIGIVEPLRGAVANGDIAFEPAVILA